jgi:RNA polymerase sigma factor (sigma-70 family)
MVLRVCRRVLGHEQDAEDAFQATFLVLARGLGSIRKRESLANWLHGVAFRTAMKSRRSAARRRNHEARLRQKKGIVPLSSKGQSSFSDPSWSEVQGVLDEELQRLPDPLRSAFVLRVLEGKSGPEAAAELGCREGTVSTRLVRARRRLQDRLARRGIQLSALLAALTIAAGAKGALPVTLSRLAVQSGLLVAAGKTPAALIPAHVAALAAGVTRAMFLTKVKIAVAILLAVGLAACGLATTFASGENATPQEKTVDAKPQAAGKDGSIRLTGRVLDPDGKALAGARLYWPRLLKENPTSEQDFSWVDKAVTNTDGRFIMSITDKEKKGAPRPYLIAAADGFGFDWIELATDDKPREVTLRLVKDAAIEGRVIDTQGKPVTGAKLSVTGVQVKGKQKVDEFLTVWKQNWHDTWLVTKQPLYGYMNKILQTAATDKDGRFTIRGLGVERVATVEVDGPKIAKTMTYLVTRPGFDPKPYNQAAGDFAGGRFSENIPVIYGSKFDFIATPTRTIEGAILDVDTGKPIAGARIWTSTGYNSGVNVVSDAQGNYKLEGLPKRSEYLVGVSPPSDKEGNLLSRTIPVTGPEGLGPLKQDIELAHGVVINGRIVDKISGKGVQGGVRFCPLPDNKFFGKKPGYDGYRRDRTMIASDKEGNFRIVIIPGSGVLMAQVHGTMEVDGIKLNPFRHARFDPADAERAKPMLNGEDWLYNTAGGSIEFLGIEHAVKVVEFAEGAGPASVTLSADPGMRLKVRIEDADGKPLTGAIASGVPGTFPIKGAEFTACALDPEEPRLLVLLHRERKLAGSVTLRGDEKEPPVVRLKPTGSITGRFLDTDGQPIVGVNITPAGEKGTTMDLYRHQSRQAELPSTDKDGRFRVDGLVPGVKFYLSLHKGRTYYSAEPRIGLRQVESGKTLDLGDVHLKPTQ